MAEEKILNEEAASEEKTEKKEKKTTKKDNELKKEIEQLKAELAEQNDKYLRVVA